MIKPHGSDELNALYVEDEAQRTALVKEAESLPSILLTIKGRFGWCYFCRH